MSLLFVSSCSCSSTTDLHRWWKTLS